MNKSELSRKILSDITVYSKYAKYLPELNRRETWEEIVDRNKNMHLAKFPELKEEIESAYKFVYDKKVLPSMRFLQFSGLPIDLNPARGFNCAFLAIDSIEAFAEIMFLLLGGTGVGYSVQFQHVNKLPIIHKPIKRRRYNCEDSIQGWANSVKALVRAYMDGKSLPEFDFRDIRPKGARLVTAGGKAPGSQPLKDALHNIKKVLDAKAEGSKLTPLEAHDICCYIAESVLSGGIRRSAMISLFNIDDQDMLTCKYGDWFDLNPQRGRANNSAVLVRYKLKEKDFKGLIKKIQLSQSGEPGISLTNNAESYGFNPCHEVALKSMQFCNLTEIDVSDVFTQDDFNDRCRVASFIGTLQSSYTYFAYLRDEWKANCEKDSLLGVSMTGICSGAVLKLDLTVGAEIVVQENERVAKLININPAARLTCVKPAGTTSLVLGSSSGIHPWHSKHYIRRMRIGKNEAIYKYLSDSCPEILADDFSKPTTQAVISIPQKAPDGAITKDEMTPVQQLELVKKVYNEWIVPASISGDNKHNVSCTIELNDGEWDEVAQWLWKNRECYTGVSLFPADNHTYVQMPFEACTEEEYERLLRKIKNIDLSQIIEDDDDTDVKGEVACAGGACEVKHI
jgi:ribonucleoside-diphosphate reductase alpha chain